MLKILILVCPAALDHAQCDTTNAIDVVQAMRVPSAQQCGLMGQAVLGATSLTPEPGKQYVKVVCRRDGTATVASARP